MTRTALVIGCGGTLGGAWSVAALHALAEHLDWDPREADILQGTSAGAELVTMLGAGFSVTELVDMQLERPVDARLAAHLAATPGPLPPLPRPALPRMSALNRRGGHRALAGIAPRGRGDASWLGRLADAVADPATGWLPRSGVRLVAYRPADDRRIAFTGAGEDAPSNPSLDSTASLNQALRASWGIPGWMPPVAVGGHDHVDGGVASTASVDLIGPGEADVVYVIASMAGLDGTRGPGLGGLAEAVLLRRPMSAQLRREVDRTRARGTRVVVVSPTATELGVLGPNFMNRRNRAAAFEGSLRSARATVAAALSLEEAR